MSGYLRWQAERALGLASGVRPARRLPSFAGAASSRSDTATPWHHDEMASTETAPADSGAANRQLDAPPVDRTMFATASEQAGAMPVTPRAPVTPRGPVEPAPMMRSGDFSAGAVSQDADAPPRPRPAAPASPVAPADRRVAFAEMEHADRSAADDRSPLARPAIADDKTSSDFSGRGGLVPPVAPRIAARLARNRPAADRSEARLQAAASPAPDVHIHIGRVELTAATPAAPPRRESAANAKKPMSLEEYLRRRSGRPS
jgi:hypothetical protein